MRSVARSRNLAEPVAVLLTVLGIRTAGNQATETSFTGGLRAWRPVNVSPTLTPSR